MNSMHQITLGELLSLSLDRPINLNALGCAIIPWTEMHQMKTQFHLLIFNIYRTGFCFQLSIAWSHLWSIITLLSLNGFASFFRRRIICISYFIHQPTPPSFLLNSDVFGDPKVARQTVYQPYFFALFLFTFSVSFLNMKIINHHSLIVYASSI